MNNIYWFLRKIYANMPNSKLTRPLYQILTRIGLVDLILHIFSIWFYKNPTQEMKRERDFFSEHTKELKEVYDSLEDDRSRSVFENILKYRAISDWECLKRALGNDNLRTQYFVPEIQFSNHEIIVDCGAFTGDTVELFYKNVPDCRVIAIEPDVKNFKLLQKLKLKGLKCINAGVWSENTTLSFFDKGGGTSSGAISDSGGTRIEVKALDQLTECQSATYIKMDVEGAELEGLKGAQKIIRERKPKLAICIYHQPQDFFEIPTYIKELNPDYKLFIHHHHTSHIFETVLYAV